jgi:hypothetical protein
MTYKTLLQQIREKELIISIKLMKQEGEGEKIILNTRNETSEMIENSERGGKRLPGNILKKKWKNLKRN